MDEKIKKLIKESEKKSKKRIKIYKHIMGDVWFIVYAYYIYVDETMLYWKTFPCCCVREEAFKKTISKHFQWIEEIVNKDTLVCVGAKLDQTCTTIQQMANTIKETSEEDRYKHASLMLTDKL